jgi:hypothetical protein
MHNFEMLTFWGVPLFHTKPLFYALLYIRSLRISEIGILYAQYHFPSLVPSSLLAREGSVEWAFFLNFTDH